jgi:hypothetical protein
VARDINKLQPEYFIAKHTCALVLGRSWDPPEPMLSSVSYATLLSGESFRLVPIMHCDLLVGTK